VTGLDIDQFSPWYEKLLRKEDKYSYDLTDIERASYHYLKYIPLSGYLQFEIVSLANYIFVFNNSKTLLRSITTRHRGQNFSYLITFSIVLMLQFGVVLRQLNAMHARMREEPNARWEWGDSELECVLDIR